MNIGEVSDYLKITKKAINIYEEKGLICPEKDCNGYRIYNDNEIVILRQIKILRSLDFSIAEIKELILNKDYKVFNQKLEDLKIKEYE
ncbi:MerR family transcriptional regulator, partial [Thomasclavelia sp.]